MRLQHIPKAWELFKEFQQLKAELDELTTIKLVHLEYPNGDIRQTPVEAVYPTLRRVVEDKIKNCLANMRVLGVNIETALIPKNCL